jgi:hypothetical protein
MSLNVAVDAICDAMVSQLAAQMAPASGQPVTTQKPVYSVQRYMGAEFTTKEGFLRGLAGRTPALRVRFSGSKTLKTHVGRRLDRVESAFSVVVASDSQRNRDDRSNLLALAESVRGLIGSRMFGLNINPMRWRQTSVLRDDDQLLALAETFTTRHRVDYTIDPGNDTIDEASGQIVNAAVTHSASRVAPVISNIGTPGATAWGYKVVAIDSDGLRTLLTDEGMTSTGASALNGSNYNHLVWAAFGDAASYEISRTTAAGTPSTTGVIGSTALLNFNDTGLAVTGLTPPDPLHVDLEEDFT